MGGRGTQPRYQCSFCNKSQDQVKRLIAGPSSIYICDECVELCQEIIREEAPTKPKHHRLRLPPPREIYDLLSEYVIGQEQAKKVLSVAV